MYYYCSLAYNVMISDVSLMLLCDTNKELNV